MNNDILILKHKNSEPMFFSVNPLKTKSMELVHNPTVQHETPTTTDSVDRSNVTDSANFTGNLLVRTNVERNDRMSLNHSVEFVPPEQGTPAAEALAANAAIKVTKLDKGLHKFRGLKRPKLKALNIKKQLNKKTKQTRKKHFSTNFKGKVIDGVHELYTLTAGMILGIRFSINHTLENLDPSLSVKDFEFVHNVAFPPKGSTEPPNLTPPHSLAHTFKFKSYCPKVFHLLRNYFDISTEDYMNSVCGDYNFIEFISNSKSGQFFFYSHDGKYMIKTQTKDENKFMKKILPEYYKFLTENPHSMLVRILGMHRVEMYHLRRKVHFVIMTSVFDTPAKINIIYDLKGSLIGREATQRERETGGVLKDNDLLRDNRKLHLGPKKEQFMEQLNRDATFLASLNIMDYSLLVGIHQRSTRPVAPLLESNVKTHSVETAGSKSWSRSNTPFRRSIPKLQQTFSERDVVSIEPSQRISIKMVNERLEENGQMENGNDVNGTKLDEEFPSQTFSLHSNHLQTDDLAISVTDEAGAGQSVQSHSMVGSILSGDSATEEHPHSAATENKHGNATCRTSLNGHRGSSPTKLASPKRKNSIGFHSTTIASNVEMVSVDYDVHETLMESGSPQNPQLIHTRHRLSHPKIRRRSKTESHLHGQMHPPLGNDAASSHHPSHYIQEDGRDSYYEVGEDGEYYDDMEEGDEDDEFDIDEGDSALDQTFNGIDDIENNELKDATIQMNEINFSFPSQMSMQRKRDSSTTTMTTVTKDNGPSLSRNESRPSLQKNPSRLSRMLFGLAKNKSPSLTTSSSSGKPFSVVSKNPVSSHPWTARLDGGINSRSQDGRVRGDEIYFVGIIDILQQYNANKRAETLIKGIVNDASQISSVHAKFYARRFVQFMDKNID